ncbi:type IV conjugative transfer system pilin TraA [Erwinia mallotivora]|uniref:type IV conjugative transfer system pilin TraA n=1 Tax=Erwinia mallotivora TaxID=69222 RepID=UPI0021C23447|nr:type IV conjugative transfer system pilin TraA [Erwinia mallotivora]
MNTALSTPLNKGEVAVALPDGNGKRLVKKISHLRSVYNTFTLPRIKTFFINSPRAQHNLVFFALLLAVVIFPHIAGAEDLLKSQKTDANDTVGHGSTVEWVLYVAEVIVSVVSYIKTRNPMVFAGLIILILITRAFFSLIGS